MNRLIARLASAILAVTQVSAAAAAETPAGAAGPTGDSFAAAGL
jgi:hypothetical protein